MTTNIDYLEYKGYSSTDKCWNYLNSFDKTFSQGDTTELTLPLELTGCTIDFFSNESFKSLTLTNISGSTIYLNPSQTVYFIPGILSVQISSPTYVYQYLVGEVLKKH